MTKISPTFGNGINRKEKQASKQKETFIGKTVRNILLSLPKMKEQPTQDFFQYSSQPTSDENIEDDKKKQNKSQITQTTKQKETSTTIPYPLDIQRNIIEIGDDDSLTIEPEHDLFTIFDGQNSLEDEEYTPEINQGYYYDFWQEQEERRRQEEEALLLGSLALGSLLSDEDIYPPIFPNLEYEKTDNIFGTNDTTSMPSFFDIGIDFFDF